MFKNITCPICGEKYDGMLSECPKCHIANDQNPDIKKNKHITFVLFIKQICLFLIGWVGFQIMGAIVSFILMAYASQVYGSGTPAYDSYLATAQVNMLINSIAYGIVCIALALLLWNDYHKLLKSFASWKPIVAGIVGVAAIYAFNIAYGLILQLCGAPTDPNNNETTIDSLIVAYPIISIFVFGIIGPLCEELTYRVGLFSFFVRIRKWLAYLVTIIVFTLIHVNFISGDPVVELLNIPYYVFAAFTFCFIYDKFGFAGSLYAHVINNMQSICVTIITGYLK